MAINFEAANMAGYNNPRIEVFTAIYSAGGSSLIDFPSKSVILDCIKRGCVPVLMATDTDRTEMFILYLGTIGSNGEEYLISFNNTSKPSVGDPPVIVSVIYDFNNDAAPTITFDPTAV